MKKLDREIYRLLQAFPHMTLAQARWLLTPSVYSPGYADSHTAVAAIREQIAEGKQVFGLMHEVKFLRLANPGYKYHPGHIAPDTRPHVTPGHFWCIA